MHQNERLLTYLSERGPRTTLEILLDTKIMNLTGRVSELRARGININCLKNRQIDGVWQEPDGNWWYSLDEPLETALDQLGGRKGRASPPMPSKGPSCPSTGLIGGKRRAKIAGRYVSEGVKKELAQKKQEKLPV